uniref:hypothetical protein n=1 Tax=Goniotrichopsis reniformis TaxID=468933 RepID=UPI001FCD3DD4|nr:hypothetical protein MW428_pgp194 [Goniotrichopsis reniformis]UNJ14704.1 hypothetical protein [Goniotrichopsis reniformis]
MCICINCKYVNNCSMYFFIEKQHKEVSFKTKQTMFIPHFSIIYINIISISSHQLDWDLVECISFVEHPGKWLQE